MGVGVGVGVGMRKTKDDCVCFVGSWVLTRFE